MAGPEHITRSRAAGYPPSLVRPSIRSGSSCPPSTSASRSATPGSGDSLVAARRSHTGTSSTSPARERLLRRRAALIALIARRHRRPAPQADRPLLRGDGPIVLVHVLGPTHARGRVSDGRAAAVHRDGHLPLLDSSDRVTLDHVLRGSSPPCCSPWCRRRLHRVAADGRCRAAGGACVMHCWPWPSVLLRWCRRGPTRPASVNVAAMVRTGARSPSGRVAAVGYRTPPPAADSAMRGRPWPPWGFRMPGGFAIIPDPTGTTSCSAQTSPLQGALAACAAGAGTTPSLPPAAVQVQLRSWHTRTVVVMPTSPGAVCAKALFSSALGPPQHRGGVWLWPNLRTAS